MPTLSVVPRSGVASGQHSPQGDVPVDPSAGKTKTGKRRPGWPDPVVGDATAATPGRRARKRPKLFADEQHQEASAVKKAKCRPDDASTATLHRLRTREVVEDPPPPPRSKDLCKIGTCKNYKWGGYNEHCFVHREDGVKAEKLARAEETLRAVNLAKAKQKLRPKKGGGSTEKKVILKGSTKSKKGSQSTEKKAKQKGPAKSRKGSQSTAKNATQKGSTRRSKSKKKKTAAAPKRRLEQQTPRPNHQLFKLPTAMESRCGAVQRPTLTTGSKVYAAYWPPDDTNRETEPEFYPGVVSSVKVSKTPLDSRYGCVRHCNIIYDDGDCIQNVPDHYVYSAEDYLLHLRLDDKNRGRKARCRTSWRGVKNIMDKKSDDMWAQRVGWYVATIDGEKQSFSSLANALRAYDASVVGKKGASTKACWLNLPEEWAALLANGGKTAGEEESVAKDKTVPQTKGGSHASPSAECQQAQSVRQMHDLQRSARAQARGGSVAVAATTHPRVDGERCAMTARNEERRKVMVVAIKPSKDTKLGLELGLKMGTSNVVQVNAIRSDSFFVGTKLEVGMALESINGKKYPSYNQCLRLLRNAEGLMIVTALVDSPATQAPIRPATFAEEQEKVAKDKSPSLERIEEESSEKKGSAFDDRDHTAGCMCSGCWSARKMSASRASRAATSSAVDLSDATERVTVTITKPSKDSKLGLKLEQKKGVAGVHVTYIHANSPFDSSQMEEGMILESVNGIECQSLEGCVKLLQEAVGQVAIVLSRATIDI